MVSGAEFMSIANMTGNLTGSVFTIFDSANIYNSISILDLFLSVWIVHIVLDFVDALRKPKGAES